MGPAPRQRGRSDPWPFQHPRGGCCKTSFGRICPKATTTEASAPRAASPPRRSSSPTPASSRCETFGFRQPLGVGSPNTRRGPTLDYDHDVMSTRFSQIRRKLKVTRAREVLAATLPASRRRRRSPCRRRRARTPSRPPARTRISCASPASFPPPPRRPAATD